MPHQDARSSKKANSNYRKYYEDRIGEPVPGNFEVHHIDHNRQNNHIDNLVALPRELHKRYHIAYRNYEFLMRVGIFNGIRPMTKILFGGARHSLICDSLDEIKQYSAVCEEVSEYIAESQIQVHGGLFEAGDYLNRKIFGE